MYGYKSLSICNELKRSQSIIQDYKQKHRSHAHNVAKIGVCTVSGIDTSTKYDIFKKFKMRIC
jgi:predicted transcriptional regulator